MQSYFYHLHLHTYMYTPTCTYLHVHAYMYIPTCTRLYVHTYMYTPTCTHLHVHTCMYMYLSLSVYSYQQYLHYVVGTDVRVNKLLTHDMMTFLGRAMMRETTLPSLLLALRQSRN